MTRIAYFNGKFVPETEIVIPFRDRSFNRGDGCFDMTRTFDGRIFRLEEHVERLYRSLRYLRIDIGLEPKEVVAIDGKTLRRSGEKRGAKAPIHMVSAFAARQRLVLGQLLALLWSDVLAFLDLTLDLSHGLVGLAGC